MASKAGRRIDEYGKLMNRIQKMIATITIAETNERAKDKSVNNILLGYDPDVWRSTDMQIRDGEQNLQVFQNLNLPPPIKDKRKHSHCQKMYERRHP